MGALAVSGYRGLCQDPGKEAVRGGVTLVCRASGWPPEHPLEGKAEVGGTRETQDRIWAL